MGIFVTIEGPNGVGKSTFIDQLENILISDYSVFLTKEPSQSNLGEYVKCNEEHLDGEVYAHLIAADRCYHLEKIVEPELKNGKIVISDRYIESSLVLQKFDGVELDDIWRLNCKFRVPDLSVILLGTENTLNTRLVERDTLTNYEKKNVKA